MWAIIGILLTIAVILIMEVPPLLKAKMKKELWVFLISLLFGTVLSIAKSLQMDIPNPADWLAVIFKPFSDFLFGLLK